MTAARSSRLRRLGILPCLAALLLVSVGVFSQQPAGNRAAALDFSFDAATTAVHWTLNTNTHVVHGTFKLKSGAVHIDPTTGDASGSIVIDATSGESGDSSRDARMHSAILESGKFPTIVFRPTHIAGTVDLSATDSITVDGVMNLHGQDHPMQMTVNLHPKDPGLAAETHFTVPFVAWGLKDPSTFIFRTEKQVAIDIDATAIHAADAAGAR